MISLDASTVLLQWAVGGLLFLWVTCRRHQIGPGYGWLLRITYIVMLILSFVIGAVTEIVPAREIITIFIVAAATIPLAISFAERKEEKKSKGEDA